MDQWVLNLYGFYGFLAVGVRMAVHYVRTGDTGFRAIRLAGLQRAEWPVVALATFGLVAGPLAPVLDLTGHVQPFEALLTVPVRWLAFILYVAGVLLTLAGQYSLGDSWRIGVDGSERTALKTGGPYAIVRNPIFSGMLLTFLGLALLLPNWLALAGWVAWLAALEIQVRLVEEPYLLRAHAEAYSAYAVRAGRFVPVLGRIRRPGNQDAAESGTTSLPASRS